jgi:hypothetical protein
MSAKIKIKRSGVSGSPSALALGELAYSYLSGTDANGGDRLYIGTGLETAGEAANIEVIGGKYFTQKLDHTPGTLTANSALIVDADFKINVLNVDNITINGNAITSTDANGNIQLSPNGSGSVDVATSKIINLVDPTSNQDAATKAYVDAREDVAITYVDSQINSIITDFTIAGDSGSDLFTTGETLIFAGDTGITTVVSNNQISFDLDDTAVTPGSYGSSTQIPTFTVDQQGRLTAVSVASIATGLSILGNSGTDTVQLLTGTLILAGNTGITTSVGDDRVDFDLDDTAVTPGSYGDANTVATFTVDQQGRITSAGTATINLTLGTQTSGSYVESLVEGTGVTISNNSGEGATPTIAIGQDVSSTANVSFQNGTFTGDLQIDGDFTVSGNVVTINVQELAVEDNLIYLNANSAQTNPDLGWAGSYNDGTYAHAGLFRDATDGVFKIFDGYTPEPDESAFIDTTHPSFAIADFQANNFIGALQGNANTATALATARTIQLSGDVTGSASFDGSANINITATIAADSIALGTDTTGDYVESVGVTAGTGLSVTGTGEGATVTLAGVNATTTTKGVASFSADNFTVTSGAVTISTLDGGSY